MANSEGDTPLISLKDRDSNGVTKVKVSSVLNRDVKQFGKKLMFDGEEDTCWNSDQGIPQHVTVELPAAATARRLELKFQGGFVGKECVLLAGDSDDHLLELQRFYPDDVNSTQNFPISCKSSNRFYKVVFLSSSDFFGRITLYHFQLYGCTDSSSSADR